MSSCERNLGEYSKVVRLGRQMASFGGGLKYYLDRPPGGPDWGVRFVFTLLFPK